MAEEEETWTKLSAFDKVSHAHWKCRKQGYEELIKTLPSFALEPEKLKKFCPLVKKFVTEQNELSRMIAVEVALLVLDSALTKDVAK